jgi:hypothetical protein
MKLARLTLLRTLVPEPLPLGYRMFINEHGISHFQVHIPANKGSVKINTCEMSRALEIVLDRSNHPMLIHCNKGKVSVLLGQLPFTTLTYLQHRTGCVVGCFRRVQGKWMRYYYKLLYEPALTPFQGKNQGTSSTNITFMRTPRRACSMKLSLISLMETLCFGWHDTTIGFLQFRTLRPPNRHLCRH